MALLGILVALAIGAFGCGGESGGSGSLAALGDANGSAPAAAALLPADVPVLITLSTDLESEQWKLAGEVASRFPALQGVVDSALSSIAPDGEDFDTDVRPLLGADVTLAILELETEDTPIAMVLQPADAAKFEEFLTDGQSDDSDGAPAWRVVDGWYVLADDERSLEALLAGAELESLADAPHFDDVMSTLPGEALARMWIGPDVAAELAAQTAADNPEGVEALGSLVGGVELGSFDAAGLALLARKEGMELVGLTRTASVPVPTSGKAEILDLAPAGAIAYVSLHNLRNSVGQLVDAAIQSQPGLETQLAQAEAFLGLTIEDDLLPLFENEHAVYVRPGLPSPELTIVLSPDDSAEGIKLIARVLALGELGGEDLALESEIIEIDGTEARRVTLDGQTVFIADVKDHLVITTTRDGIADFGSSESMNDDPRFAVARDASSLPEETSGFVYVDVRAALELSTLGGLTGLAGVDSIDPATLEDLRPLETLLAYGTASADEQRFAGMLIIE